MSGTIHTELQDILRYEAGEMTDVEAVAMFANLIHSGMVWQLQGHYGRQAQGLIDAGIISTDGTIDHDAFDRLTE